LLGCAATAGEEVCRGHAISETLYHGWREMTLEGGREACWVHKLRRRRKNHGFAGGTEFLGPTRTNEGKSKREIIRCLKRYVAREVYTALTQSGESKPARAA
jgi:hypothetical protein